MMLRLVAPVAALVALALFIPSCTKSDDDDPAVTCGPVTDEPPDNLACTGLYADFKSKTVVKTARLYAPSTSFWSDGYDKSRYIEMPEGTTIDATNMDAWVFPVGTKVWKEFRFNDRKIETRLLWKVGASRWAQTAYVWSDDGKSAVRGEGKVLTIGGEEYKVPSSLECNECHDGRKDKLLGVEAISLAQASAQGVTLAVLAGENRLAPAPKQATVTIDPGLAVLHVNCGVSCHNAAPEANGHDSTLRLRISFEEATTKPVNTWELFSTTIGVTATLPGWNKQQRVVPGAPDKSVIISAMNIRGTGQMPPSTREIDFNGVAAVESWIRALPPP